MTHPLRREIPIFLGAEGPKNVAQTAEIADGWLPLYYSPFRQDVYADQLTGRQARASRSSRWSTSTSPTTSRPALWPVKALLGFYIGGMGAKGQNYHTKLMERMGYEEEAYKIQDLFFEGKRDEAIAAVPDDFADEISLVGPPSRIKERLEAWDGVRSRRCWSPAATRHSSPRSPRSSTADAADLFAPLAHGEVAADKEDMVRWVRHAAASVALFGVLVALATPAASATIGAAASASLPDGDPIANAQVWLLAEIDLLGSLGVFTVDPVVAEIVERYPTAARTRAELIDALDLTDATNELLLGALIRAGHPPSGPVRLGLGSLPNDVRRAIAAGTARTVPANGWLDALTDLLLRDGAAPPGVRSPADRDAIEQLLDDVAGPAPAAGSGVVPAADVAPTTSAASTATSITSAAPVAAPTVTASTAASTPAADGSTGDLRSTSADRTMPILAVLAVLLVGGLVLAIRRGRRATVATAPSPSPAALAAEDVLDTTRRMSEAVDVDGVLRIALADACLLVGASAAAFVARRPNGAEVMATTDAAVFDPTDTVGGALLRVIETGQPAVGRLGPPTPAGHGGYAFAAIAVVAGGSVAGAIVVARDPAQPFGDSVLSRLQLLGPNTGVALDGARRRTDADFDGLTEVRNRRRLDRDLAALDDRVAVGVAMIDVDHFKQFNDTNGHGAGDEALRVVAATISTTIREDDVVYRYGGEEFCVLLRGIDCEAALGVMERVRSAVEASSIAGRATQPTGRVTVSIGLTVRQGPPAAGLAAADKALYEAKRAGRNRVVLAG